MSILLKEKYKYGYEEWFINETLEDLNERLEHSKSIGFSFEYFVAREYRSYKSYCEERGIDFYMSMQFRIQLALDLDVV